MATNAVAVGVITGGFESDGSLDLDSMQQEPAGHVGEEEGGFNFSGGVVSEGEVSQKKDWKFAEFMSTFFTEEANTDTGDRIFPEHNHVSEGARRRSSNVEHRPEKRVSTKILYPKRYIWKKGSKRPAELTITDQADFRSKWIVDGNFKGVTFRGGVQCYEGEMFIRVQTTTYKPKGETESQTTRLARFDNCSFEVCAALEHVSVFTLWSEMERVSEERGRETKMKRH